MAIANDGTVPFRHGERISFSYLVSQAAAVVPSVDVGDTPPPRPSTSEARRADGSTLMFNIIMLITPQKHVVQTALHLYVI